MFFKSLANKRQTCQLGDDSWQPLDVILTRNHGRKKNPCISAGKIIYYYMTPKNTLPFITLRDRGGRNPRTVSLIKYFPVDAFLFGSTVSYYRVYIVNFKFFFLLSSSDKRTLSRINAYNNVNITSGIR